MSDIIFYKGKEQNLPLKKEVNSFYITEDSGKIILGNNVWDSKLGKTIALTSGKTDTDYILYFNRVEVFKVPIIKYDVKIETKNCTVSQAPSVIEHGSALSLDFKINAKDAMEEMISIGGCDKTTECLNKNNNTITINNINGNVYIVLKYENNNII